MGLAVLVAAAVVATVIVVTRDTKKAGGEVLLEPISSPGPEAFTKSVDTNPAPAPPAPVAPASTTSQPSTGASSSTTAVPRGLQGVRGASATRPGLYGGTRDNSSCNPEQLISFLQANPGLGRAWADVQGITRADIPTYIRSLTSVVLRSDTRVTNHGYHNGRATPRQAVLQAGTAVLVDAFGIPRAKCACGNPLRPPRAVRGGLTYTGRHWRGFNPVTIVNIVNVTNIKIEQFVLVDMRTSDFFRRTPGSPSTGPVDVGISLQDYCTLYPQVCNPPELQPPPEVTTTTRAGEPALQTGDVQVTLRWFSTADVDLAVTDPQGGTVAYSSPTSASGGRLDVDANRGCSGATASPVENVFWPGGASPDGEYVVTVTYFKGCPGGDGPQEFELTVSVGGQPVEVQLASVSPQDGAVSVVPVLEQPGRLDVGRPLARGTLPASGATSTARFTKNPIPPEKQLPGTPGGFAAQATSSGFKLSWTAPPSGGPVKSYFVKLPGGTQIGVAGTQTSVELPNLFPPGTTSFSFTLQAVNDNGLGPAVSAEAPPPGDTTPPGVGKPPSGPGKGETQEEYCERIYGPPTTPVNYNALYALCLESVAGG